MYTMHCFLKQSFNSFHLYKVRQWGAMTDNCGFNKTKPEILITDAVYYSCFNVRRRIIKAETGDIKVELS